MHLLIALSLLTGAAAAGQHEPAAAPSASDAQMAEIERGGDLIRAGKPAEGMAILDGVIATQEKARAADNRRVWCARGDAEAQAYEKAAKKERKPFVILPKAACYGYYLKGFALIDLHRDAEAKAWYDRALAMAPRNSQFLGEMGEWYKSRRDWAKARSYFEDALTTSELSPDDRRSFDRRRALRGLGFILIEEGKFDQAEAMFREALAIDPTDDHAKKELQYIREHRGTKI
jgi:tetratricopeptide (TPR) repeat protein